MRKYIILIILICDFKPYLTAGLIYQDVPRTFTPSVNTISELVLLNFIWTNVFGNIKCMGVWTMY